MAGEMLPHALGFSQNNQHNTTPYHALHLKSWNITNTTKQRKTKPTIYTFSEDAQQNSQRYFNYTLKAHFKTT